MIPCLIAALIFAGSIGTPVEAIRGTANYADPSHGRDYLAMRLPRGTKVTICAASCHRMRVTDYGPAKRSGDIADIALGWFARICGWNVAKARRMGECTVTVEIGASSIPLPATDTVE